MNYPKTKIKNIKENIHGIEVPDFYRWLENSNSPEVKKWDKNQNKFTRNILDKIPKRNSLRTEFKEYLSFDSVGVPLPKKNKYFFTKYKNLQNQPILYVKNKTDKKERILIDVNKLSKNGNVSLDWWYPSSNGNFLVYGTSKNGDENSTLFIKDVINGKNLFDKIPNTTLCDVAWLPDNTGFYYTRMPDPGSVPKGEEYYNQRVYFHKLGTNYKKDPIIFGEGRAKEDDFGVDLSADGRFLLVTVHQDWSRNEIYLLDRQENKWTAVAKGKKAIFKAVMHRENIYILTSYKSPNFRICAISLNKVKEGCKSWKTIVKEENYPIKNFKIVLDKIFVLKTENISSKLSALSLDGSFLKEIKIPPFSTIDYLTAEKEGKELFFEFQSFVVPRVICRVDILDLSMSVWDKVDSVINSNDYNIKQIWYESKDKTKIPMFVVCKKSAVCNGSNPLLLTGYGGFATNFEPYFMPNIIPFLERGGIYVVANIRGGGEFGEEWHRGGMLSQKQNCFDDFIAAAEYLVKNNYTNSKKLAIEGASNGGLLVATVLSQRPDLFRVVVAKAPLFDMIRYEKSLMGKFWTGEYGIVDNKKQFKYLYGYSPYHNTKDNTAYPAILIAVGEKDARVDMFHARKMCASFQRATVSSLPVLLRIETKSGHGLGKPLNKLIEESVDIWSFIFWQLDLLKIKGVSQILV